MDEGISELRVVHCYKEERSVCRHRIWIQGYRSSKELESKCNTIAYQIHTSSWFLNYSNTALQRILLAGVKETDQLWLQGKWERRAKKRERKHDLGYTTEYICISKVYTFPLLEKVKPVSYPVQSFGQMTSCQLKTMSKGSNIKIFIAHIALKFHSQTLECIETGPLISFAVRLSRFPIALL